MSQLYSSAKWNSPPQCIASSGRNRPIARENVNCPELAKFQSSTGRGKCRGRSCFGTITRSATVVCRLKLRTSVLFPGVAHCGECFMISRSRVRATLLEILGCRVGPPARDTHSSSENAWTPTHIAAGSCPTTRVSPARTTTRRTPTRTWLPGAKIVKDRANGGGRSLSAGQSCTPGSCISSPSLRRCRLESKMCSPSSWRQSGSQCTIRSTMALE